MAKRTIIAKVDEKGRRLKDARRAFNMHKLRAIPIARPVDTVALAGDWQGDIERKRSVQRIAETLKVNE